MTARKKTQRARRDKHGMDATERAIADAYVGQGFANAAGALAALRGHETPRLCDRSASSRMMARPHVANYVDLRRREHSARMDVSAERVLEEFASIAFLDPRCLWDEVNGRMREIEELPERVAAAIASVECIEQTLPDGTKTRAWRYKAVDKLGALRALAERLGLFKEHNEQQAHAAVRAWLEHAATVTAGSVPRALGPPTDGG